MRSPRLRDADGTEYDPETGKRLASHETPPDEMLAALATLAAGQRADDLGITEGQWEELRMPSLIDPLSGSARCARCPALPCHRDCEHGLAGPCLNQSDLGYLTGPGCTAPSEAQNKDVDADHG